MDCGSTCLRMVAAFYGKHYSLEGLREKSFITREGVSMLGISEATEKPGFRSICVQVTYEILQEAPCPASSEESAYTVTVNLPQNLRTSYGKALNFKGELTGTIEVMTDERSVTGRLLSPLRYLWEKYW